MNWLPKKSILMGLSACLAPLAAACGPRVETGRNDDPRTWQSSSGDSETTTDPNGIKARCFLAKPDSVPNEIKAVCDQELRTNEAFARLVPLLCDQGNLLAALDKPECGWNGPTSSSKQRYIHRFYTEADTTKDYEDVTSSIIHTPVTMNTFTGVVRMAYENFEEFRRQGYLWTSGTRENRNISGTTWDEGVQYRFRADKEAYEVGYEGITKFIQLTPTLAVHVNRATGDFERITKFAQVVIYRELPDHTTLTIRLENRQIASGGLFGLAKKGAQELDLEAMEKGYSNAVKK